MDQGGSLVGSLLPLIVLFAIFYFLIIRPQQKTAKEHKAMVAGIEKGDKIVSSGGIIVEVVKVEEEFLRVKNVDGSEMKLSRDFIAKKLEA